MDTISKDEAEKKLSSLRSGGRESMFAPMYEEIEDMGEDEVFSATVDGYNRVSGLRNYLDGRGDYEVRSAKAEGEEDKDQSEAEYKVFVFKE